MLLKENDVGGDIRQGILPESGFRQAHRAQEVGISRDMFAGGGIDGVHEVTADHKGGYAALAQQAHGLGEKVVVDGKFFQFGKFGVVERLIPERRIAHCKVETRRVEGDVLKAVIDVAGFGVQVCGNGRCCRFQFHGQEPGLETFRAKSDKIADTRRRFENVEFLSRFNAESGKPLIDAPDDGFRGIVSVLCGAPGGRVFIGGEYALKFPVFRRPFVVFGVKDLRKTTPSDKTHQRAFFFRGGQFRTVGLELLQQTYGGEVIRIFFLCAADAKLIFRAYPVIFRFISTPQLSKISQSDIPRRLACRADSLHSVLFSMACC